MHYSKLLRRYVSSRPSPAPDPDTGLYLYGSGMGWHHPVRSAETVEEDRVLARIDLERALRKLEESERVMMLLLYEVERPDDWPYVWPPRPADVGRYLGNRFVGRPLAESTVRYRAAAVESMWRGERGPLRPLRREIDLPEPGNSPERP